ncbi:helix-turn-helix domain-containing protein [Methylobacterium komagatae]|uniref:Helix-turn-helix domain-containing protein n=1 Tax=Methylobacterium komagatae TaxID=374425 RepID=A0ABW2BJN4_9HYPH
MTNPLASLITQKRTARRWSKARLAKELGISASAVSQWESGETFPAPPRVMDLALVLGLDLTTGEVISELVKRGIVLAGAKGVVDHPDSVKNEEVEPSGNLPFGGVKPAYDAPAFTYVRGLARDVPVYGIAVGGNDGDFHFNGTQIDRAIRPNGLADAKDIFALYVVNDSMYPAWREGALFYVNPHRAPAIGDDVVVEVISAKEGEPHAAFLKRLKKRTSEKVIVEQFNPPKEIEFDRASVRLYRVIPWEEALGLS